MDAGRTATVFLRGGEDPTAAAAAFCSEHGLSGDDVPVLAEYFQEELAALGGREG